MMLIFFCRVVNRQMHTKKLHTSFTMGSFAGSSSAVVNDCLLADRPSRGLVATLVSVASSLTLGLRVVVAEVVDFDLDKRATGAGIGGGEASDSFWASLELRSSSGTWGLICWLKRSTSCCFLTEPVGVLTCKDFFNQIHLD